MDMIERIRRLHSRGKKSEREIAKLTGLSRNTVAKWLREAIETAPHYHRSKATTRLAPFRLPIGVLVTGQRFREDLCLQAAEHIEAQAGVNTPIDPRPVA